MAKLTDILHGGDAALKSAWDQTEAAADFGPLPAGTYSADIVSGALFNSRHNTPGYKLTFEITEGEYAGRRLWNDLWLTPLALPVTKRDLAKLGITEPAQLEKPLPAVFHVQVKITLCKNDNDTEYNQFRGFTVTGYDAITPDPYAPADNDADTSFDTAKLDTELKKTEGATR